MSALATGVTMPTAMSLASRAEALTPQAGGHLSLAIPKGQEFDALVTFATSNGLMELSADGAVRPELATTATPDKNGRAWVFDLRKGITFHDGTPVFAENVVKSLVRSGLTTHELVDRIETTSKAQVRIWLVQPDMEFPRLLTDPAFAIRKSSSDGTYIGTGGYTLAHPITGIEEARLVKRGDYWKEGRAHVNEVTLFARNGAATLHTDIMSGAVDYAAAISPETVAFLAHLPNIEVARFEATRALTIYPAENGDQLKCTAAISCLKEELDRQLLVDRALLGYGVTGNDTLLFHAEGEESRRRAPSILDHSDAVLETVNRPTWAGHVEELARHTLKTDGVSLGKNPEPVLQARTYPSSEIERWLKSPSMCRSLFGRRTAEAERFCEDLERARAMADDTARHEAMQDANTALARHGHLFLPAWAHDISAFSKRLKHGPHVTRHRPNDGHRLIERWWITS